MGLQLAVVGEPALVPLGVAIPGAQAGTSEAKPARDPARTAAEEAMRWMTSEHRRGKAMKSVVEGTCSIGGRGIDLPPRQHPATAPPRCATSEFFWGVGLQLQAKVVWVAWGRF
jgi:hypothetical protein